MEVNVLMVKSRRWVLAPAMAALVLRPWLAALPVGP